MSPAPVQPIALSDADRDALMKELFDHWEAESPGAHHCFCGSDKDLVEGVSEIRAQREHARDDDEIGG